MTAHRRRRRRGGRTCLYTGEVGVTVALELDHGASIEAAARAAGIGPRTLYDWIAAGMEGDTRYRALAQAVATTERLRATARLRNGRKAEADPTGAKLWG
jgi:hypothetical protein